MLCFWSDHCFYVILDSVIPQKSSGLFLLYVEIYAHVSSLVFSKGVYGSVKGVFQLIWIPFLLMLLNIISCGELRVILLDTFVRGFRLWLWCIFSVLRSKKWIFCSFTGDDFGKAGILGFLWVCGNCLW